MLGQTTDMDEESAERVKSLFSHGIAVAASVSDAVIIDGGLSSHISAAETTAAVRPLSSVLGVSRCEGMYGIDPNLSNFHHHHVVVRCTEKALWNARLKLVHSIISTGKRPRPVLVILAGNEPGCEQFLRVAAELNWGIIVVPGTGGHADILCGALAGTGNPGAAIKRVADYGNVSVLPDECGPNEVRTLCRVHLMLSGLAKMWHGDSDSEGEE